MSKEHKRRCLLIEMDVEAPRWSSKELEAELNKLLPDRRPVVFGEISGSQVDAAYRKIRQLSNETEKQDTLSNRIHSAMKALSFFRDMFPDRYWEWFAIGAPQDKRKQLLQGDHGK